MQQLFSVGLDISVFYVMLVQLQTERKCSIMQAFVRKHCFAMYADRVRLHLDQNLLRTRKLTCQI